MKEKRAKRFKSEKGNLFRGCFCVSQLEAGKSSVKMLGIEVSINNFNLQTICINTKQQKSLRVLIERVEQTTSAVHSPSQVIRSFFFSRSVSIGTFNYSIKYLLSHHDESKRRDCEWS